jgi:hypothetical protein
MNVQAKIDIKHSTCPHDCPSVCSLDMEVIDGHHRTRARGEEQQLHGRRDLREGRALCRAHPSSGPAALSDEGAPARRVRASSNASPGTRPSTSWLERFLEAEREFGTESVWPYYYAGTMGYVMRDGINRLRHVKKYSRQYSTICTAMSWTGYVAGTGHLRVPIRARWRCRTAS